MVLRFGDYSLDPERFELRHGSEQVHVEPQVFDVLAHLIANRDRVVGKNELLEVVWGSRFVSEAALSSRIKAARRAVGDDGERQAVIATVRGRGFRFIAPVTTRPDSDETPAPRPGATPAARPASRQVPTFLTPLVGREADTAAVAEALIEHRLLTLIGPGGVGKTRCAVAAAMAAGARLAAEIDFVDLVPVEDPSEVIRAAAEALGVPPEGELTGASPVLSGFDDRDRVIVLDNAEHLLGAVAELCRELLLTPGVRILVTSRERLRLRGERVYPLQPLSMSPGGAGNSPAMELFEIAARRLDPAFRIAAGNRAAVETLCRRVDGLPLGIELLAAHVRLLPPAELLGRLGNRIASLSEESRDAPARQRTLQDTLEWSLHLLGAEERTLLTRLAVFRTGADIDAVGAVAVPGLALDPVGAVATLVDKSLLRPLAGSAGTPRFGMLSLVHTQLSEDLVQAVDADSTRRRHASYHHRYVRDIEERRWTDLADVWLTLLTERYADIEAALRFGFAHGNRCEAAATVASLYAVWHREARLLDGDAWTAQAMAYTDDLDIVDQARLHIGAGYLDYWRHRTAEAREHWERATALAEQAGDDRYRALGMVDVAGTWMGQADRYESAIRLCRRGVDLARSVGEIPLISHAVNVLGELFRLAGEDGPAIECNSEGRQLARELGDEHHQAIFELNLSVLSLRGGRLEDAAALASAALERAVRLRRQVLTANALVIVAGVDIARGRPEVGARLLGAADRALAERHSQLGPGDLPDYLQFRGQVIAQLGEADWERLASDGALLSLAEATAAALGDR